MSRLKKASALATAILVTTPGLFLATAATTAPPAQALCSYIRSVTTRSVDNIGTGRRDYYYYANVRNPCSTPDRVRVYGYRFGVIKSRSACLTVGPYVTVEMSGMLETYPSGIENC